MLVATQYSQSPSLRVMLKVLVYSKECQGLRETWYLLFREPGVGRTAGISPRT